MMSLLLSKIPERSTRETVVAAVNASCKSDEVAYILFPLGRDHSKAIVTFRSAQATERFLAQQLMINGEKIKIRPAPRQTYRNINAEVDPLIVASLPDRDACLEFLRSNTGVAASFSEDTGSLTLSGSLLEIQCAQIYLDDVFQQQQEAERRELLFLEQDLATPRSDRSVRSTSALDEIPRERGLQSEVGSGPNGVKSASNIERAASATVGAIPNSGKRTADDSRAPRKAPVHAEVVAPQRSAPPEAWGERSGPVRPPDGPSVTLDLDADVMSFIRKIHKPEVQAMERKYDAMFFFKASGEVMKTRMVSNLSLEQGGGRRLEQLKQEFVKLYQSVFFSVVKETLQYDASAICGSEVEAVAAAVGKAFASRVYINVGTPGEILLVGNKEFVSLVEEWVRKKMNLVGLSAEVTEPLGQTASSALELNTQPSSGVEQKSMSATWSGKPSQSKAGPSKHRESTASRVKRSGASGDQPSPLTSGADLLGSTSGDFAATATISRDAYSDVTDMVVRGRPAPRTSGADLLGNTSGDFAATETISRDARGRPAPRTSVDSSHGSLRTDYSRLSSQQSRDHPVLLKQTIGHKVHVTVMAADITTLKVDAIVNASNETLHHIGSIAASIDRVAGKGFQEECTRYVAKYGPLKMSEVMSTRGRGHLLCTHVIHAVAPMWSLYEDKQRCAHVLRRTFTNVLYYANNKLKVKNLAIPAIGAGIYGIPLDVCARTLHEALQQFSPAATSLRDVTVLELEEEGAGMIAIIFQQLSELRDSKSDKSEASRQLLAGVELERTGESVANQQAAVSTSMRELQQEFLLSEKDGQISDSNVPAHGSHVEHAIHDEEGPVSSPPSPEDNDVTDDVITGASVVTANRMVEVCSAAPQRQEPQSQYGEVIDIENEGGSEGPTSPPSSPVDESALASIAHAIQAANVADMFSSPPMHTPRDNTEADEPGMNAAMLESRDDASDDPEVSLAQGSAIQAVTVSDIFASAPARPSSKLASGFGTPSQSQSGQQTPRSDVQSDKSGSVTPRSGMQTPRLGSSVHSPRSGVESPRSGKQTPRSGVETPKSGGKTPRSEVQTPRSGAHTPQSTRSTQKSGAQTPRSGLQTPQSMPLSPTCRSESSGGHSPSVSGSSTPISQPQGGSACVSGQSTPRSEASTPRSSVKSAQKSGTQTPQSGVQSPPRSGARSAEVTPTSGAQTPAWSTGILSPRPNASFGSKSGSQTPKSGTQTPKSGSQTPKSGAQTPVAKSGTVTPKSGILSPKQKSGGLTPRSTISGQLTPKRSSAVQSQNSTPRSQHSTAGEAGVSTEGTPRAQTPHSEAENDEHFVMVGPAIVASSSAVAHSAPPPTVTHEAASPTALSVDEPATQAQDAFSPEPLSTAETYSEARGSITEGEQCLLERVFSQQQRSTQGVTPSGRPTINIDSIADQEEPMDTKEMNKIPLLIRLVSHCVCIATRAGEIIRTVSEQSDLGVVEKERAEVQTEADRSAQTCIVHSLTCLFPGLTVIGEEGEEDDDVSCDPKWVETSQSVDVLQYVREVPDDFRNIALEDVTVWVDPLDGTSDFVARNLQVCTVLIGIAVGGRAVAGIIHQPFYDPCQASQAPTQTSAHPQGRTVWGVQGMGVFGLEVEAPPAGENIVVTSRRKHELVAEALRAAEPTDVLYVGGSGYKMLMMLEGRAHALVYPLEGFMKWDTCAVEAVLGAAGGRLTDLHGNSYQYSGGVEHDDAGGVLAAVREEDHEAIRARMPEELLEQVPSDGPAPWDHHYTALSSAPSSPTDSAPLITQLVAAAVDISLKAGEIIRDIMTVGDLGIVEKGKNDLQTQADRSVEQCIMNSFVVQFPTLKVIGEEGQAMDDDINPDWVVDTRCGEVLQAGATLPPELSDVTMEEVTVWVDPLDGTAEYTQGLLDHVTVLIGIAVRGQAVAGVIYQPYYNYEAGPEAALGRIIWSVVGLGAFGHQPHVPPADQNIITTTRSHGTGTVMDAVNACQPTEVLKVGGAGHKVLLIIEGRAHAYVFASPGCKKWDTCAPEAVLHAIGGKLTDIHGNAYQYHEGVQHRNSGGVLATTTAAAHAHYVSKIPQSVLDELPTAGPAPWQRTTVCDAPLVTRLVAASVNIALKSGEIIRDTLKCGDLGIVQKGVNDLQTQADRSVEQCIVKSLETQFPDVRVIAEEGQPLDENINPDWVVCSLSSDMLQWAASLGQLPEELCDVRAEDVTVWVDPLDGTVEFTQGLLDHVTVLIGIAVRGRAVAGVIYQPYYNYEAEPEAALGRVIWGVVGLGAFGHQPHVPPADQNIITTTRSHGTGTVMDAVNACQPTEVLKVGGAGHKVLLIIEGRAHAYVFASPGCKKWDTCAPEAVLHAIGGKLTDIHGHAYQYHEGVQHRNSGGVLATTTAAAHAHYVSKIPQSVLDELPTAGPAPWQFVAQVSERLAAARQGEAPLITRLVAASVSIAARASEIIRDVHRSGELNVVEKDGGSLQTEADRSSEQCIVASLLTQFPGVAIVAEENVSRDTEVNPDWIVTSQSEGVLAEGGKLADDLENVSEDEVTVWVDPLDGTREFIKGNTAHVTVLIGVAVRGEPVAGVICYPFAETPGTMWAIRGSGVHGLGDTAASLPAQLTLLTSGGEAENEVAVAACGAESVVRVGGVGHKMALLAQGKAHVFVKASRKLYPWDTCAGDAILRTCGGHLSDIRGAHMDYSAGNRRNVAGVLATRRQQDHARFLERIPDSAKQDHLHH